MEMLLISCLLFYVMHWRKHEFHICAKEKYPVILNFSCRIGKTFYWGKKLYVIPRAIFRVKWI